MEIYNGTDRNRQIDWLRQTADGITYFDLDGSATSADAAEFVDFWMSQRDTRVPSWFDDADKALLVSFVAEMLD